MGRYQKQKNPAMGECTKAGRLILCLEAVSLESDNKILKQIVDMSLITPRFWSEGPLPGTSGSGW